MGEEMPVAELHAGFSSPGATPTDWAEARRHIDEAEVFWLSTVRPDGRRRSGRLHLPLRDLLYKRGAAHGG